MSSEIVKEKKTADKNKYMKDYMRQKYNNDKVNMRKYKNSLGCRKKYDIDEETLNKYKDNLSHIIKLKKLIDELPTGVFEMFLLEYKTLDLKLRS